MAHLSGGVNSRWLFHTTKERRNLAGATTTRLQQVPPLQQPHARHLSHAPPFHRPRLTCPLRAVGTLTDALSRPDLSRRASDPLPPLGSKATCLLQVGEGLWCLRQDFWLAENICINSHVVRLRNGGLMLISPPAPTEEALALLDSLTGMLTSPLLEAEDVVGSSTEAGAVGGGSARAAAPAGGVLIDSGGGGAGGGGSGGSGGAAGGRVEHVVVPNLSPEHWYHAAEWASRCAPGAKLWLPPGMLEGRATAGLLGGPEKVRQMKEAYGSSNIAVLPDRGPLPGLEEEVAVATYRGGPLGGLFCESTLGLLDHRAVVFADMAFAVYEHPLRMELGAKLAGIYRQLGCPLAYPLMRTQPEAASSWLAEVLRWDFDMLLLGHLDPCVRAGGKEQVRRCFGFLLGDQIQDPFVPNGATREQGRH